MTKILIVEDEPGIYTFLKEGLIDEGYDTLVATDGSEALRDFADWKPDLVLLDWMLPTMDGIEVCRSIRETDVTTPVLFLTAKDGVEDTIKGLRTGANDYIKKPFSFDELLERIKIHFRNRQHDELLRCWSISSGTKTVSAHVRILSRTYGASTSNTTRESSTCS